MKQNPENKGEIIGTCELCGEPIVKHTGGFKEKSHYFAYFGSGLSCNIKNCEQNHGKGKCEKQLTTYNKKE
jgi:hypothetical protein|tara:strand:+ start:485 stop:697 length:213 start_codon:yes stop_codon:yes gene_type:complete